ncbi:MAG: YifB family Mg chelatase-like AAA ATPase [Clostridia bacterium]|nr:ATP-binding protein [Oscillospiraceae bacterium]MBR4893154.1 YifB family Mg chelatase-like AAA ATPase [Clostridia bacterium]
MLARIHTCALYGIDSFIIDVESDISNGMATFEIVGLGDTAVKESKERIKASLKSVGSHLYRDKIVVNLAPASIKKEGSHLDLPIALSILSKEYNFSKEIIDSSVFIGELALNGELRSVDGILPMVISAYEKGFKNVFLSYDNIKEAAIVKDINIYPVKHIEECILHLTKSSEIPKYTSEESEIKNEIENLDFSDVKGQDDIKRALLVAASGNHNFLMVGTPGSGKTMIAERIPTILPPLSFSEALEVSKIYSVAGLIEKDKPLITKRPFRQVHHTISTVGITGGGRIPKPGEITLAHRGVLFLDELLEFKKDALETLRQPVEEGKVTVTRVSGSVTYPCNVMLIASLNPCPCGYYGSNVKECTCSDAQIRNYMKKISGPLLDRIDIQIEVPNVLYKDISDEKSKISSKVMAEMVLTAREIQKERYKDFGFLTNKDIPAGLIDKFCPLGEKEKALMEMAYNNLGLSARAHSKILKVARTIADLEGAKDISVSHLAEAIQYRNLDKKYF